MVRLIRSLGLLFLAKTILAAPVEEIETPKNDKYLVQNLPGLDQIEESEQPIMYAGHIELNAQTDTNYFFWKFIKKETNFNRTIIWLNGGPGCSSMDGALMEVGPLRVHEDGGLYLNKGSWYYAADMIFVDQPGGTGFSITKDYDKDLDEIADDFAIFLKQYFESFPDDANKELYIAGESYAGQYIPYIADRILRANKDGDLNVDLKGLLIGNGWIAPNIQSLSYIPYMLDSGIITKNDDYFPKLLKAQEKCQNEINSGEKKDAFSIIDCEGILNRILSYTRHKDGPKDQDCINMYDTRLRDSYPSCGMNWPSDLPKITPFLQNEETIKSLNLNSSIVKKWRECDSDVSRYLTNKNSKPSFHLLPDLLEQLPILLFSGNRDIICNSNGLRGMISQLNWGGFQGFSDDLPEYDWKYDGESTGIVQNEKNLTWIDVYESSHMVPFDKPYESRGLFDIMVGNFKIVETLNSTYVETPVYSNSTKVEDGKETQPGSEPKNVVPFLFYLATIGIIGVGLYLYNRGKPQKNNNSILRNNRKVTKHHNKKTVSWADEGSSTENGKVGRFFNNFTSNEPGYKPTNNNDYEDIELQSNKLDNDIDDFEFDLDNEASGGTSTNQR